LLAIIFFIQSGSSRVKGATSPLSRNGSNIGGSAAGNAVGLLSRDRNGLAPKLSRIVGAVGALDINGRAAGNTAGLSNRDENGCVPELSGTVSTAVHLTSVVEWIATRTMCGQPDLLGTPPTACKLLVVIGTVVCLSSPGQSKRRAHLTSTAEWRATASTCDQLSVF
jgi:hypothetical protein